MKIFQYFIFGLVCFLLGCLVTTTIDKGLQTDKRPQFKLKYAIKDSKQEKYVGQTGRLVKVFCQEDYIPGEPALIILEFPDGNDFLCPWSDIEPLEKNAVCAEYNF